MLPDVVLIRGSGRSGTTMLADTLNASPQAAIMVEYPLGRLTRDLDPIFGYADAMETQAALRDERFTAFRTGAAPKDAFLVAGSMLPAHIAYPQRAHTAAIVADVVARALDKRAPAIVGSKTPGSYSLEDDLRAAALFPHTRVLFAVREPRATMNSIVNRRNLTRAGLDAFPLDLRDGIASYLHSLRIMAALHARMGADVFVVDFDEMHRLRIPLCEQLSSFLGIAIPSELPPGTRAMEENFTRRDVLTDEEAALIAAALPDVGWGERPVSGVPGGVLPLAAALLEPVVPGRRSTFAPVDGFAPLLATGWSTPREGSVWSTSERADLVITVERTGDYEVALDLQRMTPPARPVGITLRLDGAEVARVGPQTPDAGLPTPALRLRAGFPHVLEIAVDELQNPARLGTSPENCDFGILLHALTLRPL
jgi:hypothetical protein